LRWPHAGGDRSRRNHANQRADRPVDTLHATTAIPVARFQARSTPYPDRLAPAPRPPP
jgi:hypothetical protein